MSARRPGETRLARRPEGPRGRGLLGLVLVLLAGLVGPDGPTWSVRPGVFAEPHDADAEPTRGRPLDEPVAAALAPLGPIKAIVSSALWLALLGQVKEGGSEATVSLAEALLAVHPELETVRSFLAQQLAVNEAGRAPDDDTHWALVLRGLTMLEDGTQSGSPRLRATLGRLLVERVSSDPRFEPVARQYFGADPLEIAIEELRAAATAGSASALDVIILADLLVTRGTQALDLYADRFRAERDLAEAERLLESLSHESAEMLQLRVRALREGWGARDDEEGRS